MKTILESKGLCKSFTSGEVTSHVIRNLDVTIYEKDFTVIMGTSGAGKSTLLYLLSGIDQVTSGEIELMGRRIDGLKEKHMSDIRKNDIGFVFQEPNLLDDFTVFENIALTGYLVNKNKKEVNNHVKELLEELELDEHAHKYPSQLSGGQKQRVAIGRSLINKPSVIFADEPTGALNARQSDAELDLLTKANNGGQSILMVTHDIKAACRANRLLFIKDGKIDGELDLNQFQMSELKDREQMVFEFVMNKGW